MILCGSGTDLIDEIIADDYVEYNSARPEPLQGPDDVEEYVSKLRTAVPDIRCGVEELIAEGDMVVRRDRATGTHEGALMGIEATGTAVEFGDFVRYRFDDGKVVEVTSLPDLFGLFLQVSAIDPPGV